MYRREPVGHAPHPLLGSCLLHGRPAWLVVVSAPAASAGWWCQGRGCGLHMVCGVGPGVKIRAETGAGVETAVRLGASASLRSAPCGSAVKPVDGGFSAELSLHVRHCKRSLIMAIWRHSSVHYWDKTPHSAAEQSGLVGCFVVGKRSRKRSTFRRVHFLDCGST